MPAAPAERSTYSRLLDIAAPGGSGSAAPAAAGIARAVRHAAAAAALLSFMLPSGGKRPLPRGPTARDATPVATGEGVSQERLEQPPRLAQRERHGVVAQRRPGARARGASRARPRAARTRTRGSARRRRGRCRTPRARTPAAGRRGSGGARPTASARGPPATAPRRARVSRYGSGSTMPASTSAASRDGEHRARDVEMALQVAEAAHPEEQVAHDQQRPALAHDLERARERAGLAGVVGPQRHPRRIYHVRFND